MRYSVCIYLPTSFLQARYAARHNDSVHVSPTDYLYNPHMMCVDVEWN